MRVVHSNPDHEIANGILSAVSPRVKMEKLPFEASGLTHSGPVIISLKLHSDFGRAQFC